MDLELRTMDLDFCNAIMWYIQHRIIYLINLQYSTDFEFTSNFFEKQIEVLNFFISEWNFSFISQSCISFITNNSSNI